MTTTEYAIELKGITKTFGDVVANKNIDLNVKQGEILALLGENGSGKTTLMNMLSGIYSPDSGFVYINGNEVNINSPEDSKKFGIGMVHQHFKLIDVFSATDNIWLGKEYDKFSISNWILHKKRYNEIDDISRKFGFEIDSRKKVCNMSVSEKQTLEIIKVLCYGAKIIILDEPTAVLTVQEIENLFVILKRMKGQGHSIIIITHKLDEVMGISDRVTVLRKGEFVGTVETSKTSKQELTELMVGRKVDLNIQRPKIENRPLLLEIRDLKVLSDEKNIAIKDLNFYIRGGEILGVAGVAGCGQKELCETIAGLRKPERGMIIHKGENILNKTPQQIIEKGIAMSFIPEDRLGMGLAPSLSITDNMLIKSYKTTTKRFNPFINRQKGRVAAKAVIKDLSVIVPSTETPVRQLSGGNVQKVLLGREIKSGPNVIITAYPVRGLDINSSYAIYDILNKQKKNGVGVLFVGEDLDVMMALCDKIMVLCHGTVMGIVHANTVSKEDLGLMMTGSLDISHVDGKVAGIAEDSNIKEVIKDE